jgi:hypothetical protein
MNASDLHTCIETFFEVRENDGARTDQREREGGIEKGEREETREKTRKKKGEKEKGKSLSCLLINIFFFILFSLFLLLRFFPPEWSTLASNCPRGP